MAGRREHIAQGVFLDDVTAVAGSNCEKSQAQRSFRKTKSDIWRLSSHKLRTSRIAVRHLFNPVARGAPMATCIRKLHCWKLSQSKCWVQTSKYVSIFLGGPRLLFIFSSFHIHLTLLKPLKLTSSYRSPCAVAKKCWSSRCVGESFCRLGKTWFWGKFSGFTMFHHVSPPSWW